MPNTKSLRKISIGQLQEGMFIVGLDIPWIQSPFFRKNKKINSQKEIEQLKKAGAKIITIDPNRGADLVENTDKDDVTKPKETPQTKATENASRIENKTYDEEISVALEVRSKLKNTISHLQEQISANQPIDVDEVSPVIDETLDSLERNNHALLNLAHISRRSQKLVDHTFSTFCIALNLSQVLNIEKSEIHELGVAALLHEAGWAQLPLQLMGKRSKYNATELRFLHKHPELGLKILESSNLSELTRRIICEHHERVDGSGYPNKLTGEKLHQLSRLFAVVDQYDECVHQLTDSPGMLPFNALQKLFKDAEAGFLDKNMVKSLISLLGIYPVSSAVRLNSGEKGVVREVPQSAHLRPIIEIFYNQKDVLLDKTKIYDLRSMKDLKIVTVIDPKDTKDDPAQKLEMAL